MTDLSAEYPKAIARIQTLERELGEERAAFRELSKETARMARENFHAAYRRATEISREYRDMATELRSELTELQRAAGHNECERCRGEGGEPEHDAIYSADGLDIVDEPVVGYGSPDVDPCSECMGTGYETTKRESEPFNARDFYLLTGKGPRP